jgi:CHAD domain-containing protein
MVKKGRQKKHFNEAWQSMLTYLSAFCQTQEPEALHRFRVQVKKVRALLLFLQKNLASEHLKPLQSIFKQAGKIRSAQIHLAFVEEYQVANAEFKKEQEKIANSESKRFCSKLGAHLKTLGKLRKTLAANFQDIENKVVVRFYKKQLKKLNRYFAQPNLPIGKLHLNRKRIKNLLYFHDILPESLAQKLQLNTAYLDQLQDAIGQWHDVVAALALLKTRGFANKKMLDKLERRSRRLLASIFDLTNDFKNAVALSPA